MISIFAFTHYMIYKYIKCHELLYILGREREREKKASQPTVAWLFLTFSFFVYLKKFSYSCFVAFFCYWCFIVDWHSVFSFILLIFFPIHAPLCRCGFICLFVYIFLFLSWKFTCSSNKCNILCWFCLFHFHFRLPFIVNCQENFLLLHFYCKKFISNEY